VLPTPFRRWDDQIGLTCAEPTAQDLQQTRFDKIPSPFLHKLTVVRREQDGRIHLCENGCLHVRISQVTAQQSFVLLPSCSESWIGIPNPRKSGVDNFVCRRSVPTATLPEEGPDKNKLSSHPPEPVVNQRGLSDTGPGNDRNGFYILVCLCIIQKSDILRSTKKITSRNRQSY